MGRSIRNHRVRQRKAPEPAGRNRFLSSRVILAAVVSMLAVLAVWSYWPTMADLFHQWQRDENYSAGQLVPLVALFLVWHERKTLKECTLAPCWWGGVGLLLLAQAGCIYGLLFMFESAQRYSLVLAVAALILLVAGPHVVRRVSWILLFLFLMIPLPGKAHNLISGPLQSLATGGAVFLLEAFGARVSQQGNVVMLNQSMPLAIVEACSGLRMLTAFIIVAAFIAYMVQRPRWQKTVLLVSSIPVAVICNMIRIFLTAMLMLYVSEELAEEFFHDFAGLVMMPAAVMLIFGEIWVMDKLIVSGPEEHKNPATAPSQSAAPVTVVFCRKRLNLP